MTWDVDVLPGAAYAVHPTSSSLTAPRNTPLPGPLVVIVSDGDGNPVPGIPVTFDIETDTSSATGSFGATSGVTDALGYVTTTFTCGATAGIAYVGAHAAGINGYGPITCTSPVERRPGVRQLQPVGHVEAREPLLGDAVVDAPIA